jgi:NADH:ubiquinone oxidoreductase subunit 5 (subunit L)/multisubunit Na+/H+ antiporter MnhA subunit
MAASIDLLIVGWELVGMSSVLLIGFFRERREPVYNALRVYATYRTCDVGLLLGAMYLHRFAHASDWEHAFGAGQWSRQTSHLGEGPATLVVLLLLLAAIGKSAQFPVTGWLPRAMEGPTPSSALFYGALSVHAGVYLLLRAAPLLAEAPKARVAIGVVGALTALTATLSGRAQTDVKSALSLATATQVGFMFVEVAAGLYNLVVAHMAAHIVLRTFQFLRAPSALHDALQRRAASGGARWTTGRYAELLLPKTVRSTLYAWALERFHLDVLLETAVARPVRTASQRVAAFERAILGAFAGQRPISSAETAAHRDRS